MIINSSKYSAAFVLFFADLGSGRRIVDMAGDQKRPGNYPDPRSGDT